jgi:undecaprenyl-diphosphatase
MTILEALILGVIEGITEFLPISSTGHLILGSYLLGIPDTAFLKSFEIAIQLGAIGAVAVLYWRSFLSPSVLKKLFCGFLPTAIIGLLLYPYVKGHLLGNELVVVSMLAFGGVLLILFELFHNEQETHIKRIEDISYLQACGVGLFQSLALVPGVSRSAATITGGLLLGLGRVAVVEFSFLLAVPTMTVATGYDILKNYTLFTLDSVPILLVGFVTAFVVALFAVKFLLRFIKNHTFIPFGIYRIILATLFFFLVL